MKSLWMFAGTAVALCLAGTEVAREQSTEEIAAAVLPLPEDLKAGAIKAAPMGTMMYRYSDDPKRIKLLWAMQVPNQTPESLGVSSVRARRGL